MSRRLTSLVQATDDPSLTLYAITHLRGGLTDGGRFCWCIDNIRTQLIEILARQGNPTELWDAKEQQLTLKLFQQSSQNLFIHHLSSDSPDTLRHKLADNNPFLRLLAVSTVGRRHVHLEKELIDRLHDPHPAVREAAHQALVLVCRGTDFGPIPGASQKGIARSVEKWQQWLALQNGASPETIAKAGTSAATKPAKLDPDKAIQLVLDSGSRMLRTAAPEATQLSEELVKAKDNERIKVLERLRDAKGIDNTDALALAIPKLSAGAAQRAARDALIQRLTRMKAATLRDKLQEDNVEIRRAAARACGRKQASEHIPDLLQLLDDPEVAVIQAARQALKELTGQDFGPDEEAGRRGRASAATAWRKWWQERDAASVREK